MVARSKRSEESEGGKDLLRVAFGDVLRDYRKSKPKLSQTVLSAQAGLPSNAIGDLERGERTVKAEELKSICKVLEVPVKAFLRKLQSAQLKALGETEESEEVAGFEPALETDLFYFGVAVMRSGGKPDDLVKILHKLIHLRGAGNGKEEE